MNRYGALEHEPEPVDLGPDGPKMWSNNLVVFYETDPEVVAAVLPQPLEPTDPIVRVNLARVDMPDMVQPLEAGTFSVACRHGEVHGYYDLLMLMSTEAAVTGGRETFGEPKKIGRVSLERRGSGQGAEIVGVMQRAGVDLVEIRGSVVEVVDPGPVAERFAFYYKFLLDPQGGGFDHDPSLVHVRRTQEDRLVERVDGTITLRESPVDPLVDFPVRSVVGMTFTENHQTQTGAIVGTVPGEWLWPFRHQRYDGLMARLAPATTG